jgi:integrase
MKKWDRGPKYRWTNDVVTLREIERKDLVKDRIRVRGTYTKEDGRPGTFDALNWPEARKQADEIKKRLEQGRAARSKSRTFAQVWKEWDASRDHDDLAPQTRGNDKRQGRYLLMEFGNKKIDSILPIDAESWLKALKKSKPGIVSGCRTQLGMVMRFARRKNYLPFNRLADDPIKLPPKDWERPWVPGWDPMDRIVDRGQELRPANVGGYPRLGWSNTNVAIALGGGAGLRISEAVAIRWEHVDFANSVLRIRKASTSRGLDDLPKKRKIRDVPMTQWVYDALFEHMHVLQALGVKLEGPVIYNRKNAGRPTTRDNWSRTVRLRLVQAGVLETTNSNGEWDFQVLRRFYISARYALGHKELEILEAVAHSRSDVTMKHYARALPEPPAIWRYRFRLAEPEQTTKVIDGGSAVVVDGIAQLPAPEIDAGSAAAPAWAIEAARLLDGGWTVAHVRTHLRVSQQQMFREFKRLGWGTPIERYNAARDRRFEELQHLAPIDIATQMGLGSVAPFFRWRRAHEAGVPNRRTSLKLLEKSRAEGGYIKTDTQPKQLSLLNFGPKTKT